MLNRDVAAKYDWKWIKTDIVILIHFLFIIYFASLFCIYIYLSLFNFLDIYWVCFHYSNFIKISITYFCLTKQNKKTQHKTYNLFDCRNKSLKLEIIVYHLATDPALNKLINDPQNCIWNLWSNFLSAWEISIHE